MITSRTKKQLVAFVILTLVGVAYVGARYARLDKLFYDSSYDVNAHFAESGGIFTGAEVTYRGVRIGQVSDMELIKDGVNVVLEIDNDYGKIPADTRALVGNKSAVGEQYVELQPQRDDGPYLKDGSVIDVAETSTPVSTTELLSNANALVSSIPTSDLRTVVSELGAAFHGTGPDIARIIDTTNAFIADANDNFEVTKALIQDGSKVLQTQVDKGSAIRSFAKDLSLFTDTLADKDQSLRTLIENGSASAAELRTFLQDNQVNLGQLIANLVSTGEVTIKHLKGTQQILAIYPYLVAGGFTVAQKINNHYYARFGLILTQGSDPCVNGYPQGERRSPDDLTDRPMAENAACTDPIEASNPRGAQNIPRPGTSYAGDANRAPVATYDAGTGSLTWSDEGSDADVVYDGGAHELLGKDSWKWLLLQPAMGPQG